MIDFNKLIDNHLAREYRAKTIGRYYPSEAGSCLRKTWFSYKNPKPNDVKLTRIFEAGNMLHEFISEVIKSEKNKEVELLRSELPIEIKTKDFIISGRIDNLVLVKICEKSECKQVLVEVKSTKFLPKEKKPEHKMQLQLYMRAIGVNDGIILYIQKDNLETRSFEIKHNKKVSDKIIERFQVLHQFLTENKLPEAEAKLDSEKNWMCDYCSYAEECAKE
ncbi:Dna2/Cas4 domain-containing protein [Candidatus Pacearchaeota archaeon]|nr:Dna2/Cas4 domain-containing protein [Candidatus Pacearchaeota archaeon]